MGKVKEEYVARQEAETRTNYLTGKVLPKKREKKDVQIEGQISFYAEGTQLIIDDSFEREQAEKHKAAVLDYYAIFLDLLNKYGDYNKYYRLVQAFEGGNPGKDAVNAVNYHYNGDIENVRVRLSHAGHWLKVAGGKFQTAAHQAGLPEVVYRYDEAYLNKERRNKFRQIIKRERGRWSAGRTTLVYSPDDLENEYQHWRFTKQKGSE